MQEIYVALAERVWESQAWPASSRSEWQAAEEKAKAQAKRRDAGEAQLFGASARERGGFAVASCGRPPRSSSPDSEWSRLTEGPDTQTWLSLQEASFAQGVANDDRSRPPPHSRVVVWKSSLPSSAECANPGFNWQMGLGLSKRQRSIPCELRPRSGAQRNATIVDNLSG